VRAANEWVGADDAYCGERGNGRGGEE
jgi:hypothetical protein